MFGFLIDRVGRFQLEEFIGCTYLPLARSSRIRTLFGKKKDTSTSGPIRLPSLQPKAEKHKERIQKAVDYWYVKGLDMFGNSKSYRSERYMHLGIEKAAQCGSASAI